MAKTSLARAVDQLDVAADQINTMFAVASDVGRCRGGGSPGNIHD